MRYDSRFQVTIFLTNIICAFSVSLEDYCGVSKKNLPCFTRCERNKHCGNSKPFQNVSQSTNLHLEDMLNGMRNFVAGGGLESEPPAQNMFELKYDEECEFLAGCLMKTCYMDDVSILITYDGVHLGYNGYGQISSEEKPDMDITFLVDEAISSWYKQGVDSDSFTQDIIDDDLTEIPAEFLQMVWGESKWFGCAKITSHVQASRYYLGLACVFKPAAEFHKKAAYKGGPPAVMCNQTSSKFANLCLNIEVDKHFSAPVDLNRGYCAAKMCYYHFLIVCIVANVF